MERVIPLCSYVSFLLMGGETDSKNVLTSFARSDSLRQEITLCGTRIMLTSLRPTVFLVLITGVHLFITRTFIGKAIRAATQDPATAQVMGVNVRKVYALTFAIAAATAALGGTLIGMTFSFFPTSGLSWLLKGFVIVALGGMGSIVGMVAGAFLLGTAEGIGPAIVGTGYRDRKIPSKSVRSLSPREKCKIPRPFGIGHNIPF